MLLFNPSIFTIRLSYITVIFLEMVDTIQSCMVYWPAKLYVKIHFGKKNFHKISIERILFHSRCSVIPIHRGQIMVWGIPI
jgi:hypothetical protein